MLINKEKSQKTVARFWVRVVHLTGLQLFNQPEDNGQETYFSRH